MRYWIPIAHIKNRLLMVNLWKSSEILMKVKVNRFMNWFFIHRMSTTRIPYIEHASITDAFLMINLWKSLEILKKVKVEKIYELIFLYSECPWIDHASISDAFLIINLWKSPEILKKGSRSTDLWIGFANNWEYVFIFGILYIFSKLIFNHNFSNAFFQI